MKVIGLTGGIGAGKSTVSDLLRQKGYLVIDADELSHQITEKGSSTLKAVVSAFGKDILTEDGNLNRKKLAAIVFHDDQKKKQLEKLTTDVVIQKIKSKLAYLRQEEKYDIIFLDAPLLFETGADRLTDLVWLVTAELEIRIDRVQKRDHAAREEVISRMKNQMSSEEKMSRSQEIIDNSKGKDELYRQVEDLLLKYAE